MKAKLLLVDDHHFLRDGLRQAISRLGHFEIVGEASTGADALKLATDLAPDLIMMDIHLPDMDGLEASRRILGTLPRVKVIIFSADVAREKVDEALQAGVCGYILKSNPPDELADALGSAMAGRLYLSPELSAGILDDYRKSLRGEAPTTKPFLSDRETLVLRLVAQGRRNKDIATELAVSTKSVEAYRSRLMRKLSCPSPAELVRYAIREGIAEI